MSKQWVDCELGRRPNPPGFENKSLYLVYDGARNSQGLQTQYSVTLQWRALCVDCSATTARALPPVVEVVFVLGCVLSSKFCRMFLWCICLMFKKSIYIFFCDRSCIWSSLPGDSLFFGCSEINGIGGAGRFFPLDCVEIFGFSGHVQNGERNPRDTYKSELEIHKHRKGRLKSGREEETHNTNI